MATHIVSGPRCRQCDIEFDTVLQFNKHKSKFCTFASVEEAHAAAQYVKSHSTGKPR